MVSAAAVGRVSDFDLNGILKWQADCIRQHKCSIIGRATEIRLGVDDNAEYTKGPAWKRICAQSKVMGLTLKWEKRDAPFVAFAPDKQTLLFVDGIAHRPKVEASVYRLIDMRNKDLPKGVSLGQHGQLVADNKEGKVAQSIFDFASGSLTGRGGERFVILQPIEQVIILANVTGTRFRSTGTMLNVQGRCTFDGRYPFMLVSPFVRQAYLAGGRFSFDTV